MGGPPDYLSPGRTPRVLADTSHLLGDKLGVVLRPPDREGHTEDELVAGPHFTGGPDPAEFG